MARLRTIHTLGLLATISYCLFVCGCAYEDESAPSSPLEPEIDTEWVPEGSIPIAGRIGGVGSTLRLEGDRHVPSGQTLEILAGTRVVMGLNARLRILGETYSFGTADSPVLWESASNSDGIDIRTGRGRLLATHSVLRGQVGQIRIDRGSLLLYHCEVGETGYPVIRADYHSYVGIFDSRIDANRAIEADGSHVIIEGSELRSSGRAMDIFNPRLLHLQNSTLGPTEIDQRYSEGYLPPVIDGITVTGEFVLESEVPITVTNATINGYLRIEGEAETSVLDSQVTGSITIVAPTVRVARCRFGADEGGPDGRRALSIGGDHATVELSSFYRAGLYGAEHSEAPDMEVVRCVFARSEVRALASFRNTAFWELVRPVSSATALTNCAFVGNDLDLGVTTDLTISGCLFSNGDSPNISFQSGSLVLDHCLLDNGLDSIIGDGTQRTVTGLVTGNPGFSEAGRVFAVGDVVLVLDPSADSSCRDAGPPQDTLADLDGTRNDIGIFGGPDDIGPWLQDLPR